MVTIIHPIEQLPYDQYYSLFQTFSLFMLFRLCMDSIDLYGQIDICVGIIIIYFLQRTLNEKNVHWTITG